MKYLALALAGLALAACAGLTDRTGLTVQEQACIANTVLVIQADPATAEQPWAARVVYVANACLVTPAQVQAVVVTP